MFVQPGRSYSHISRYSLVILLYIVVPQRFRCPWRGSIGWSHSPDLLVTELAITPHDSC